MHLILGKPGTVVPDDAVHHAVGDVGHDRDVSLAFPAGRCDRLGGVYQHVQEYLVELAEVAADRWNVVAGPEIHLHGVLEHMRGDVEGVANPLVNVGHLDLVVFVHP